MNEQKNLEKDRVVKDVQLAALVACTVIALGFAVYWWGEIQSMRELLDMAYG